MSDSPTTDDPPPQKPTRKRKAPLHSLKRNQACATCRKRKVQCDAARPTCGTCERSYKHSVHYLKPGQPTPTRPICSYETDDPAPFPDPSASSSFSSLPTASSSCAPVPSLPKYQPQHSQPYYPLPQQNGFSRASSTTLSSDEQERRLASLNRSGPGGEGGSGAASETATELELRARVRELESMLGHATDLASTAAQGGRGPLPPPPLHPSSSRPPLDSRSHLQYESFQSPSTPLLPPPPPPQQHARDIHRSLSSLYTQPRYQEPHHPSNDRHREWDTFPPTRFVASQQQSQQPSRRHSPTPFPAGINVHPSSSNPSTFLYPVPPHQQRHEPDPYPEPSSASSSRSTFTSSLSLEEERRIPAGEAEEEEEEEEVMMGRNGDRIAAERGYEGGETAERAGDRISGVGEEGLADLFGEINKDGEGGNGSVLEGVSDAFLMDLLWPGWPPHLPSPGLLEHIVDVFFDKVPFAPSILNQGRLRSRLSLPPMHQNFPHPAILHAICACTARHLGVSNIFLKSSHQEGNRLLLVRRPNERNALSPSAQRPTWDGMGQRPAHVSEVDGIEGDFGEVHLQWSKLYVQEAMFFPADWLSIVKALALQMHYLHQHALWTQGWTVFGVVERMCSPLGLYHERCPQDFHKFMEPRRGFQDPPEDAIDRIEQQNLLWYFIASDTMASTGSGWPAAFDLDNVTHGLPICHSSQASSSTPFPTQYLLSQNLFIYHPDPHANSFTLAIKGIILVRKAIDFVRAVDRRGGTDPRGGKDFRELDGLLKAFLASLPRKDAITVGVSRDGSSVDADLLSAQSYAHTAIIQLHDRYIDIADPDDPSQEPLQNAAQALVQSVYSLCSTNYDVSQLHMFLCFCWFTSARTSIRYLELAVANNDRVRQVELRSEIETFRLIIHSMGQRLPLALRQLKLIEHLLAKVTRRAPSPTTQPPSTAPSSSSNTSNPNSSSSSSIDAYLTTLDSHLSNYRLLHSNSHPQYPHPSHSSHSHLPPPFPSGKPTTPTQWMTDFAAPQIYQHALTSFSHDPQSDVLHCTSDDEHSRSSSSYSRPPHPRVDEKDVRTSEMMGPMGELIDDGGFEYSRVGGDSGIGI